MLETSSESRKSVQRDPYRQRLCRPPSSRSAQLRLSCWSLLRPGWLLPIVGLGSLTCLAVLGSVGAKAGGARLVRPALRVAFWGALAMGLTTAIGAWVGKAI